MILINYKKVKVNSFHIDPALHSFHLPRLLQLLVDQTLRLFAEYLYSNFIATIQTPAQVFSCKFCKNLSIHTLWNICEGLFLYIARLIWCAYYYMDERKPKKKRKKYSVYNFWEHGQHCKIFWKVNERTLTHY